MQLGIAVLAFLLCELIIVLMTLLASNRGVGSLLALAIALVAWMFSFRQSFIIVGCMLLVYLIVNAILAGWSSLILTGFLFGTVTSFVETLVIGLLRSALDLSETAKQQLHHVCERERRLSALKNQLIVHLSHELRTPLTGVRGSLDILQNYYGQLDDEEQRSFLTTAGRGCDELERLVNNMLDALQIDQNIRPPFLQAVLLNDVIRDVLQYIDPLDHTLYVDLAENIAVQADPQRLRQVIRNLLSNALKYSPPCSAVTVRTSMDHVFASICIKDAGPGIAAADIPLLFQKFARLRCDVAGPIRGAGLGLYISKRLVENMGGQMWVESTGVIGEGSCFYFTLPRDSHD